MAHDVALVEDLQQAERQRDELLAAAKLLPGRVPFDELMALVERIEQEQGVGQEGDK